ncbi:hypothetical protein BH10ACT3_BH10ACT3_11380 [soil metagenome]
MSDAAEPGPVDWSPLHAQDAAEGSPDTPAFPTGTPVAASVAIGAAVVATAAVGTYVQTRSSKSWYDGLRKPPGQPPSWLFGPVWTVLYAGIAWNGIRLWRTLDSSRRQRARALWVAQLATNAAWTPLFFGLRRPGLALIDQVALDAFTVALRREVGTVDPTTTKVLDAYLAWLAYATYLNAGVVLRNR